MLDTFLYLVILSCRKEDLQDFEMSCPGVYCIIFINSLYKVIYSLRFSGQNLNNSSSTDLTNNDVAYVLSFISKQYQLKGKVIYIFQTKVPKITIKKVSKYFTLQVEDNSRHKDSYIAVEGINKCGY